MVSKAAQSVSVPAEYCHRFLKDNKYECRFRHTSCTKRHHTHEEIAKEMSIHEKVKDGALVLVS